MITDPKKLWLNLLVESINAELSVLDMIWLLKTSKSGPAIFFPLDNLDILWSQPTKEFSLMRKPDIGILEERSSDFSIDDLLWICVFKKIIPLGFLLKTFIWDFNVNIIWDFMLTFLKLMEGMENEGGFI